MRGRTLWQGTEMVDVGGANRTLQTAGRWSAGVCCTWASNLLNSPIYSLTVLPLVTWIWTCSSNVSSAFLVNAGCKSTIADASLLSRWHSPIPVVQDISIVPSYIENLLALGILQQFLSDDFSEKGFFAALCLSKLTIIQL